MSKPKILLKIERDSSFPLEYHGANVEVEITTIKLPNGQYWGIQDATGVSIIDSLNLAPESASQNSVIGALGAKPTKREITF